MKYRVFAANWGAPVSDDRTTQVFTVQPGMSAREIGDALEQQKLIRSGFVFRVLVEQTGVGGKIYDRCQRIKRPAGWLGSNFLKNHFRSKLIHRQGECEDL